MANVVLEGSQCGASIQIDGVNFCCQKKQCHDAKHITREGTVFTDAESWSSVFAAEQEAQRRVNESIAAVPGQGMTRS